MITPAELLRVLLVPLIVSTIIAAIGYWRRWTWMLPLAAGFGFLTGFALIGVPKLPPQDGTDWLFWLAIPLMLVGVASTFFPVNWRWPLGAMAGGIAYVVLRPLLPGGAEPQAAVEFSIAFGLIGWAITWMSGVWSLDLRHLRLCLRFRSFWAQRRY